MRLRRSSASFQEEGEYEYVSYRGAESGNEEDHVETGVLYQSLNGEAISKAGTAGSTTPLCEAVAEGPCARLVPDDHSPNRQSACNRTGQHCSGHRGGGHGGGGSINVNRICEGAGLGAAIKVVAKQALGPAGTAVTVACAVYGGVQLVKVIL
jgi:hypothetical protein